MNVDVDEVNRILANVGELITVDLAAGRLCGVLCEICPLRTWKSAGITRVHCGQVLAAARQRRQPLARLQRFLQGAVRSTTSDSEAV